MNRPCTQTDGLCWPLFWPVRPEGGRRRTRPANCAAGKAVMRGGGERRAAAASQLLESCAPEPCRTAAALTRFTSPSAASGENLRGGQSSTPPSFKPSPGFSRLLLRRNHAQALGSRPAPQQVRPGARFLIVSSYFFFLQEIVFNPLQFRPSFRVLPVAAPLKDAAILDGDAWQLGLRVLFLNRLFWMSAIYWS